MIFPSQYKILNQSRIDDGDYSIVPIRYEDRWVIRNWRNEQIYHLRQADPLSKEKQDWYFNNVVSKLFEEEQPNQLLFSFLKDGECIGYGGLVHMNWLDKHAEISFIMDTKLENEFFSKYWNTFLGLIEKVGFKELEFHKLFVYAFDLRPHLYTALISADYFEDARLKEHCVFNGAFKDVVIYSKINQDL